MDGLILICNLVASIAGLFAAYYWYRSAAVPYPTNLAGIAPIGGLVHVNTSPLLKAVQEVGRLNKKAAIFSAVATLFLAVSVFWGAVSHL